MPAVAKPTTPPPSADADAGLPPEAMQAIPGINKKVLAIIAVVTIAVWAFAISTGSLVLLIIVGVLTAIVGGLLLWAFLMARKQRGLVSLLQGAVGSDAGRRDALATLAEGKDAGSPVKVFARAQLMAQDDPKAALALLDTIELKAYPAAMQDDVALLKTQLLLGMGRTQDARKAADTINLDNPSRKAQRPLAAAIVAEAWARTGKSKEAIALLDSIQLPTKDAAPIALQMRIARVFARFAGGQRSAAKTEMQALANDDLNHLGRFLMPQFRVHPELQQVARQVLEAHPGRKKLQQQVRRR